MKALYWWIALSAAALTGAALVLQPSGLESLKARDPQGAIACDLLAHWLNGDLDAEYEQYESTEGLLKIAAGKAAYNSTTTAIQESVTGNIDIPNVPGYTGDQVWHVADLETLYIACASEGVDLPPMLN